MATLEELETLPREAIIRPVHYNPFADRRELFILNNLNEEIYSTLMRWAAFTKDKPLRLLDMGCGQQPYRSLIEKLKIQYSSFDVQQNHNQSVDFLGHADGALSESLLNTEPFDLILCTEVPEHVLHWETFFKNLRTLLKPGGRALLTCPFFFPLHEEPYDYYRPTLYALEGWAHLQGFQVMNKKKLGSVIEALGLLLGHMLLNMKYHHPRNNFDQIRLSIKQRMVRFFLNTMHRLVRSGLFNENYSTLQDFYISNSFEIQKGKA